MFQIALTEDSSSSDESMPIGAVGGDDDEDSLGPPDTSFVREDTFDEDDEDDEYIDEAYADDSERRQMLAKDWQLDPDDLDNEEEKGEKQEGGASKLDW